MPNKDSCFVVLDNKDYIDKFNDQLERTLFDELEKDWSNIFSEKH